MLSSQPVTTLAAAVETVKWYLCRWEVEVYFRIYKSGCRVERLQLEISEHLEPALALYMIIAWRIQSIVMLGVHPATLRKYTLTTPFSDRFQPVLGSFGPLSPNMAC